MLQTEHCGGWEGRVLTPFTLGTRISKLGPTPGEPRPPYWKPLG